MAEVWPMCPMCVVTEVCRNRGVGPMCVVTEV